MSLHANTTNITKGHYIVITTTGHAHRLLYYYHNNKNFNTRLLYTVRSNKREQ